MNRERSCSGRTPRIHTRLGSGWIWPGGKLVSGKTRRNASRAAAILRMAAQSLARAHCALGAFYRRMRARLGAPKAITATAHKLAKIVYNMLRYGRAYVDVGADYYEKQYRERVLKNLAKRAAQFGLSLTPIAGVSVNDTAPA
jgi:transposase